MARSIYLISPAPDFPSYFNSEVFEQAAGGSVAQVIALALPTVAALAPDDFEVTLCDECAAPIDFDSRADFVGITGNISQARRIREIARIFRDRGKVVLIGGPQATLRPGTVRSHCDILVKGEIEEIAEELFDDLRSGSWKDEYVGNAPDLAHSPRPRLDLYPNDRTLAGAIQISRGCPNRCEFCETIQYNGRKQRYKSTTQVIEELDQLHALGYRHVFITDDNLTGLRKRVKALLVAIADWNRKKESPVEFSAQIAANAADDDELLGLLEEAGIAYVFVGIETPNESSLRGVNKDQNLKHDMHRRIERFIEHGIVVMGGMVVGFDSDGPDIFRRQYEFAMSTPIPLYTPVTLFAHETTPMYARFRSEGRVIPGSNDMPYNPWNTNVVPLGMSREQLFSGLAWLINRLFEPRAFTRRLQNLAEQLCKRPPASRPRLHLLQADLRPIEKRCAGLLMKLPLCGLAEAKMVGRLAALVAAHPRMARVVMQHLMTYLQFRHVFERGQVWQPALARLDDPWDRGGRSRRESGVRTASDSDSWRPSRVAPSTAEIRLP